MAAAALGSQTGDSLYAPASAASLVTLRGTDGMQSDRGVMPLSWLQDYAGTIARSVPDLADILNVVSGTDPKNPETAEADAHRPADWRSTLAPDALKGARIGMVPSTWVDPYGTSTVIDASKAALQHLAAAGAQVVEVADGPVAPPRPNVNVNWEGWARYLEAHPELATQLGIDSPADVVCSQLKMPYTTYSPSYCDGTQRMTEAEVAAWRAYRTQYQRNIAAWMDANDLDAVVYPGLLSEISLNDGGGNRSSFGRRDTPSSSSGVPSVAFPAGTDANGAPIDLQLMGRAWDDAKIVGYAYAYEHAAPGHVAPATTPALRFVKESTAPPTGPSVTKATSVARVNLRPAKVRVGKGRAKVVVRVTAIGGVRATGGVRIAVAGRVRTAALVDGRATVRLKPFALRGRKVVHVRYLGSATVSPSEATAVLRVAR
jgi:amidase